MRVHFFERNNLICAYFPDTLRYFRVNKKTKGALNDIQNDIPHNMILERNGISTDELNQILGRIPKDTMSVISSFSTNNCRRLVLHIANDCNLTCKYCYANGGVYLSKNTVMPLDILFHALDRFFGYFKNIQSIQLFGGEPCLNLAAIEAVGSFVEKLPVHQRPNIYIVTNGTLLSEEAIELFMRYQINVTISLDGPNTINDQLRIFTNGDGSTSIVEDSLRRILNKTDIPIMIEATYTKLHQEYNIRISDIIRYYFDEFGIKNIHIALAAGSPYAPDYIKAVKDDVSQIFTNAAIGYPMPAMILNKLRILKSKKNTTQLCDAGIGTYAVSANGMVYPCFMLTDQTNLSMGSIVDKNLFNSDSFCGMQKQLKVFNKIYQSKCNECFANTVCTGCIGKNYFESDDIAIPSEDHCTFERTLLEEIVLELFLSAHRVSST